MKAQTMLETISSLLGLPMRAIPLSLCHIKRWYLLERSGVPSTGTAILFAIPYVTTADVHDPERNLSLYAVVPDYHGFVQMLSDKLLPCLCKAFPTHRFAFFTDHSPIDEVDAAARAGLGVIGLNHLLITPEWGSLCFMGEIITDAPFELVTENSRSSGQMKRFQKQPPHCEACGACIRACPMGALAAASGTHTSICLSSLTQKKGALSLHEITQLQGHPLLWGCDACQLSCPHNRRVLQEGRDTPLPYFKADRLLHLTEAALDAMNDSAFSSRAYAWRGRDVIRRNLQIHNQAPKREEEAP